VLEQIGVAVQGRLEEMGLRTTSTPLLKVIVIFGSKCQSDIDEDETDMTGLRASYDRHVSYLTNQIWELMAEVQGVFRSAWISKRRLWDAKLTGSRLETQHVNFGNSYGNIAAPERAV
jgi:hypothetical protein